jgi:uncharacterized protein (DUF433 family)
MNRKTVRDNSDWEDPGDSDWKKETRVPKAEFKRWWDQLVLEGVVVRQRKYWGIAAACLAAVPNIGVKIIKTSPLTLKLEPVPPVDAQTLTDDEDAGDFGDMNRIVLVPDICSGKPTIKGTRIMVSNILGMFSGGYAISQILEAYHELSTLDVISAVEYASRFVDREKPVARK